MKWVICRRVRGEGGEEVRGGRRKGGEDRGWGGW